MLAEIIDKSGERRSAWAERFGISKSYLSELCNGNRRPSLAVAARIERLTAGAVPIASWQTADELAVGADGSERNVS